MSNIVKSHGLEFVSGSKLYIPLVSTDPSSVNKEALFWLNTTEGKLKYTFKDTDNVIKIKLASGDVTEILNVLQANGANTIVIEATDSSNNELSIPEASLDVTIKNILDIITGKANKTGDTFSGSVTFSAGFISTTGTFTDLVSAARIQTSNIPSIDTDVVNKSYLDKKLLEVGDSSTIGIDAKESVVVATTSNIQLTNSSTTAILGVGNMFLWDVLEEGTDIYIDDIPVQVGNRILLKNQSDAISNGIYIVENVDIINKQLHISRTSDAITGTLTSQAYTWVEDGTINKDTGWKLRTTGEIIVGTTPLNWSQFSGGSEISADYGIIKEGNTLKIKIAEGETYLSVTVNGLQTTGIDAAITSAAGDILAALNQYKSDNDGAILLLTNRVSALENLINGGEGSSITEKIIDHEDRISGLENDMMDAETFSEILLTIQNLVYANNNIISDALGDEGEIIEHNLGSLFESISPDILNITEIYSYNIEFFKDQDRHIVSYDFIDKNKIKAYFFEPGRYLVLIKPVYGPPRAVEPN